MRRRNANKIEFELDRPVGMHLVYAQGLAFDCPFDPRDVRYVFTAEEGRFYLSDTAGGLLNARLRAVDYEAGEPLVIVKRKVENAHNPNGIAEYFPAPYRGVE